MTICPGGRLRSLRSLRRMGSSPGLRICPILTFICVASNKRRAVPAPEFRRRANLDKFSGTPSVSCLLVALFPEQPHSIFDCSLPCPMRSFDVGELLHPRSEACIYETSGADPDGADAASQICAGHPDNHRHFVHISILLDCQSESSGWRSNAIRRATASAWS